MSMQFVRAAHTSSRRTAHHCLLCTQDAISKDQQTFDEKKLRLRAAALFAPDRLVRRGMMRR